MARDRFRPLSPAALSVCQAGLKAIRVPAWARKVVEAAGIDSATGAWNGVLVAANTPRPIIARLNAEMNAVLKDPDVEQKMHGFGFDLIGGTPEAFASLISGEAARWAPVIKKVGLKVD